MMSIPTDDQLARFRAHSDSAFASMLSRADNNMADFLNRYGKSSVTSPPKAGSAAKPTLQHRLERILSPAEQQINRYAGAAASEVAGWPSPEAGTAPSVGYSPNPGPAPTPTAAPTPMAAPQGGPLKSAGMDLSHVSKAQLADSLHDLQDDFQILSRGLKSDSKSMAQDAIRGTKDILQHQAFDLGKRAKEEAAALKEAAKKAMEEERSLKGLRGRATEEMRKMKERMKAHVEEAKDEVLDDLQEMATGKLGDLMESAEHLFEGGQGALEREWNDLKSGHDS